MPRLSSSGIEMSALVDSTTSLDDSDTPDGGAAVQSPPPSEFQSRRPLQERSTLLEASSSASVDMRQLT
jgi:hypothetical protein